MNADITPEDVRQEIVRNSGIRGALINLVTAIRSGNQEAIEFYTRRAEDEIRITSLPANER